MRSSRSWTFAILLVTSLACAPGPSLGFNSPNPGRYDILRGDELRDFTNVAAAVITLRPRWASSRGCAPGQRVSVFVDRLPSRSADVLMGMRPDEAREIRHFSASEAMIQLGGSHPCGAILVLTGA